MSSFLSKNGYVINKASLTNTQLNSLKTELVGKPAVDEKYLSNVAEFPLYTETINNIYIPKMYGLSKFGQPEKELANYRGSKWDIPIEFTGKLYPNQIEPCAKLHQELLKNKGGILSLSVGGGKTVNCLYILSLLRGKSLIIVNKISLMEQWESEIQTFLPDAKIGFIHGKKKNTKNCHIVLAMLQTLSRGFDSTLVADINTVVMDECHNASSPVFSQIFKRLCCEYTIGLSATPFRSDKCEYIFEWYVGPIVFKSSFECKGKPPIIMAYSLNCKDYKQKKLVNKYSGQESLQFTSMITDLISMESRNKFITECIKHCASQGRQILVMSERKNHIKMINEMLLGSPFTFGMFFRGLTKETLAKTKTCQVIIATFQSFGEGVSIKDLDTLILTTPKKYTGHLKNQCKNESGKLEQFVGRIFRKTHEINPMIIDLQDNFSIYNAHANSRNIFYKKTFKDAITNKTSVNLNEPLGDMNELFEIAEPDEPQSGIDFSKCLIEL